jgi:hypothetical protein
VTLQVDILENKFGFVAILVMAGMFVGQDSQLTAIHVTPSGEGVSVVCSVQLTLITRNYGQVFKDKFGVDPDEFVKHFQATV